MPYADPERRRQAARARYQQNREEYLEKRRERNTEAARRYRAANGEARRERDRVRYAANPEAARTRRSGYYAAKPERHREVARNAHSTVMERDPESFRARVRKRWAQEKGAEGSCSAAEWQEILDFYGNKCLRCEKLAADCTLTQDHVIPVSKGGSHWPENLQPLCRPCNSAKGARNSTDYRPDRGMRFARREAV